MRSDSRPPAARDRRRSPRVTLPSSTPISMPCGRSSEAMSKDETLTAPTTLSATVSPQYRDWLRRERRGRIAVRGTQLALLAVLLVAWEILPRAQFVNPLFTSYPSALWPAFLELLEDTPRQASILVHTRA